MRTSPKQINVKGSVDKKFAWSMVVCDCCGHQIRWENYFSTHNAKTPWSPISFICTTCCDTREKAYDATFSAGISAKDVSLINQVRMSDFRLEMAREKIDIAKKTFEEMSKKAVADDSDDMGNPFNIYIATVAEGAIHKLDS